MPRRVRMCGGNRVMSSPLNTTVPASERAGNAIDQRRLSRAVRADQAEARGNCATRPGAAVDPGILPGAKPSPWDSPMPTSNRSVSCPWSKRVSLTSRTAVYGPVRTVVWEGRSREAPPYPDPWHFSDLAFALCNVRSGGKADLIQRQANVRLFRTFGRIQV
jgi:hypothetical protein